MVDKISVIIATYNEQGNIAKAIACIRKVLPLAEIVIADDGSVDKTLHEAKSAADDLVKIISLSHRGKGNAIRGAVDAASGEIMVQIDADLQFPAEGITRLIQPILEQGADIVFGSRYLETSGIEEGSVSFIKRLASLVAAWIVSGICLRRFTDVFAGFKAWRNKVIRAIDIREKGRLSV
ncbi:MAG: glycosyltransferase family 2 protein [Candidatus Omnitrophica bacterium]|nr:glycosyltransferase family 2 protein [Candidatus Omnitrophota bacterium]